MAEIKDIVTVTISLEEPKDPGPCPENCTVEKGAKWLKAKIAWDHWNRLVNGPCPENCTVEESAQGVRDKIAWGHRNRLVNGPICKGE